MIALPSPAGGAALAALRRARDGLGADAAPLDDALLAAMAAEMHRRGRIDALVCGEVYEASLRPDRPGRRAAGAYYTPRHLVDFVVRATLGPLTGARVRVLDPACGGGAFAIAAGRHLRRRLGHPVPVYGADVDATAAAVCRLAMALDGIPGEVACVDSLLGELPGGFDAIVGNPPWGQKGLRFAPAAAAALRRRYRVATGVLDPFKLFVERTHELLAPEGRWGLILPDIVLLKDQEAVRQLILEHSVLERVVHAGRAFEGVNLDAAVLIARRGRDRRARVRIWHALPVDWRITPPPTRVIPQRIFARLPGKRFNLHLTRASFLALRGLAALPRLGEQFEIHEGVHSGNARRKLFVDVRPAGPCAPLIVGGGELARFCLRWRGRWIDLDPAVLDRAAGDYANLGKPAWHRAGKLIVRRTGDHIVAACDERGYHVSNNAFVLLPRRPMAASDLHAHVALLNSAMMTWYFRTVQPRVGRLFAELKINHLADFPLPPPAAWAHAREGLAALARRAGREATHGAPQAATVNCIDDVVDALFEPLVGRGHRE